MYRTSTTLFLDSPGAITPIPWVNGAPDFSSFSDPELSILKQSWQEFLDSGKELKVVSAIEQNINDSITDWDGFNLTFATLPSLLQAESIANQNHPSIVGKKDTAYSLIDFHGTFAFSYIFPLFCQAGQVDAATRIEWAELAESFNLPPDFVNIIRG